MKGPILTPRYVYLIGPVIMWFLGLVFDLFDVFIYEQGSVQVLYVYVFPSKNLRKFASYYIISFRMSSGATCTMLQSLARP